MDGFIHLEMALDRLRTTQIQQGALLEAIAANQIRSHEALTALLQQKNATATMMPRPLRPKKSPAFWRSAAMTGISAGAQYAAGILSIHYLLNGGDVLQLLQVILKSVASGQ